MSIETGSNPRSQQLLTEWNSSRTNPAGTTSFDRERWLIDFYEYFYSRPRPTIDRDLGYAFSDIIFGLYSVVDLDLIRTVRSYVRSSETRVPLFRQISHFRRQRRFEHLLCQLADNRERAGKLTYEEIEVIKGDLAAMRYSEDQAGNVNRLPSAVQSDRDRIKSIRITDEDIEEQLIDHILDSGEQGVIALNNQFGVARTDVDGILEVPTAKRVLEVLATHQDLFGQLEGMSDARLLYINNNVLPTLTPGQLRKALEEAKMSTLLNPQARRNLLFRDMEARRVVDPTTREMLPGTALVKTCYLRMGEIDQLAERLQLSDQERKALYASLIDLIQENLSPALVEGLVKGTITRDELADAVQFDWLLPERPKYSLPTQKEEENTVKHKLAELGLTALDLARYGIIAALLPAFLALRALAQLLSKIPRPNIEIPLPRIPVPAIPLPRIPISEILAKLAAIPAIQFILTALGIKKTYGECGMDLGFMNPFQGEGGASLDFDINPFRGIERLGHGGLWKINRGHADYYRLKTSSTFDLGAVTWQDDTATSGRFSQTGNVEVTGELEGSQRVSRDKFTYLPIPYDMEPVGEFDRRTDGAVGIDYPVYPVSPQKVTIWRYADSEQKPRSLYPFNETAGLTPLIEEPAKLPRETRKFLDDLAKKRLSRRQEFDAIVEYIRDNFIYSLDPNNTGIYADARDKGEAAFLHKVYEYKRVKCDGAATAAIAFLRLRNIPSRMAVGFHVDPGAEEILAKNAHAWVEALIDGELVRDDPTPTEMDEVTRQMMAHSNFIMRMIEQFRLQFDTERTKRQMRENLEMARDIFNTVSGQSYSYSHRAIPQSLYKPWDEMSRREKAIVRQKVIQDEHALESIRDRVHKRRLPTTEVITQFGQRDIVPEDQIRYQVLEQNLSSTVQPLVTHLFSEVYGKVPFDEEFLQKYGLMPEYYMSGDYNYWDTIGNNFVKLVLQHVGDMLNGATPYNTAGELTLEYIDLLTAILQYANIATNFHREKWIKETIVNRGYSREEFIKELQEQEAAYSSRLTPEITVQNPLTTYCASFVEAVRIISTAEVGTIS